MKLWYNTTKRLAKKLMGRHWRKLNYAKDLKPGDLISTCMGYNERIRTITPDWTEYGLRRGSFVFDFDIVTESGNCCSLIHCCTIPLETKKNILSFWSLYNPERGGYLGVPYWEHINNIAKAVKAGIEVFDEDGQPLYEYCQDHEKKKRFPERYKEEGCLG